ncbi:response regulator transcription factor [Paenalkalicoccus suaedae]|uniref:Response regulator transcription factor n=1 Tax=Paenalkalicoccus suaedae TaxID=2592382 RepID=A0A859FEQ8_9BACI|nr:response regulator transcription factor [Paenalkalicoccus suaedae]QKS70716.1 response regulator transcription factor [Paenalkalicoccus suaedae]
MRILIGMDHELLRYGLIQLIKDIRDIEYMVTVNTKEAFLKSSRKYEFDVVILHVDLPGATSIETLVNIDAITIIIYQQTYKELPRVNGVLFERMSLDELMPIMQRLLKGGRLEQANVQTPNDVIHELTRREEEIFRMKLEGYSVRDSATFLAISPKTVENHRRNIRKKLNIVKNEEWVQWGKKLRLF